MEFDFDWSMVNENSDYYIIKVLNPEMVKDFKKFDIQK